MRNDFTLSRPGVLPFSWEVVDIALDVEHLLEKLPALEKEICEDIMAGYTFAEIKERHLLTDSVFVGRMDHIRRVAKAMVLDEYRADGRRLLGI